MRITFAIASFDFWVGLPVLLTSLHTTYKSPNIVDDVVQLLLKALLQGCEARAQRHLSCHTYRRDNNKKSLLPINPSKLR